MYWIEGETSILDWSGTNVGVVIVGNVLELDVKENCDEKLKLCGETIVGMENAKSILGFTWDVPCWDLASGTRAEDSMKWKLIFIKNHMPWYINPLCSRIKAAIAFMLKTIS